MLVGQDSSISVFCLVCLLVLILAAIVTGWSEEERSHPIVLWNIEIILFPDVFCHSYPSLSPTFCFLLPIVFSLYSTFMW